MRSKWRRRKAITRWTPCPCGKHGWPSRSAAKRSMRSSGNHVRAYVCRLSGKWHLTSQAQPEEVERNHIAINS